MTPQDADQDSAKKKLFRNRDDEEREWESVGVDMAMQMVVDAMQWFQVQCEEDSDHEDGHYFFHMRQCPKNREEADGMSIKLLDSLDEGDDDEDEDEEDE